MRDLALDLVNHLAKLVNTTVGYDTWRHVPTHIADQARSGALDDISKLVEHPHYPSVAAGIVLATQQIGAGGVGLPPRTIACLVVLVDTLDAMPASAGP